MLVIVRITYVLLLSFLPHVPAKNNVTIIESCVHLYEKGVEAYLENRFSDCVLNFENAIKKYKDYTQKLLNCRLKCRNDVELSEPLYPVDVDNLLFYEKTIKITLCIVKCKQEHKNTFDNFNINKETEKLFEDFKPYEYLHICYFQTKQLQKAASAAYTYLVSHPDDKIMLSNLKHYSEMKEVDMSEIVNFEAKDYVYLYIHGADVYEKKDWRAVEENMEESLSAYLQEEEKCRVQCEGPFDQGWFPDFIPSIANHFTYCLRCKQKCAKKLNSLNGEKHDDLLPSHYHYLQYAYYKNGNLKAACAAVASYLLFYPKDETMLANMNYYKTLPKVKDDYFTPRFEAIKYIQRQYYEKSLVNFIYKEFIFEKPVKQLNNKALTFRVILSEKQLQGPKRFVSEGLATVRECRTLIDIAKMFAVLGDGYQGKKSPHTVMEKFEGVTLNRAASLVYFGLLNPQHLKLYLKITEDARKKIQQYFSLKKELYFTYTHLVCRSALPDSPENRTDFSHAIHADNCNILENGKCEKLPPAYTWRDYSAIIYLNNNFQGGEFLFAADPKASKIQSTIRPKCGRMIAFSAGSENLHGVRAVRKGSRCAVGIWFTFDVKHEENDRKLSYQVLNSSKFGY